MRALPIGVLASFFMALSLCTNAVADTYTKLQLSSNAADGNTVFTDSSSSAHVITPMGAVHHSEVEKKFGISSVYFDGNGSFLEAPHSLDWGFGSGDFTIHFWINPSSFSNYQTVLSNCSSVGYGPYVIQVDSAGLLSLYSSSTGSSWDVAFKAMIAQLKLSTWTHVAIVRSGSNILCFQDGILRSTTTSTASLVDVQGLLTIGDRVSHVQPFHGFLEEINISKGIARWTSSFDPPTPGTCSADYNDDGIVDSLDLIEKQQDVLQELQDWTENCWKAQVECQ